MKKILVIGGGASGMMAAIMAARNGANVTIYEKNDRLGKKILATGNGKCNLTNLDFDISKYNSSNIEKLGFYFSLFDEKTTIQTFNEFGLLLKDREGYVYPNCEQASVVVEVLINMLNLLGVNICTETGVLKIEKKDNAFYVTTNKGVDSFDSVIVATGGRAGLSKKDSSYAGKDGYYIAQCLGHTIIPVLPALVQVECQENFFDEIAGVRADCVITLYNNERAIKREFGEVQITDYGISGIPVFQLSSEISRRLMAGESLSCVIDFMPELDEDAFEEFITNRIGQYTGKTVYTFFVGLLNSKLCKLIIKLSGLGFETVIGPEIYSKLLQACYLMKQFVVTVSGTKGFSNAQVCCGGVTLDQIDDKMQSVIIPDLYICGEVLDVDGKCGGYNLQWAWTSGAIAGVYASRT